MKNIKREIKQVKKKGFWISLNSTVDTYGKDSDSLYNLFEILCWQEGEKQEHISLEPPTNKNDCKKELILEMHNETNLSSLPSHFYFNNEVLEYTSSNLWHSIYITHCKTCNSLQYTGTYYFYYKFQEKHTLNQCLLIIRMNTVQKRVVVFTAFECTLPSF